MRGDIRIGAILGIVMLLIIGLLFSKRMNYTEPKLSPLVLPEGGIQQRVTENIKRERLPEKKRENPRIMEKPHIKEELQHAEKPETRVFRSPVDKDKEQKLDTKVNIITHTVQSGDTLYRIAEKYYDDPAKWEKIYKANEKTIEARNLLKKGQILIIPQ